MPHKISIRERNGRYFIKTRFKGKDYSLTYGTVGNDEDLLYMQQIARIAQSRKQNDTFSGFDEWKIVKQQIIDEKYIVEKLAEKNTVSCNSVISAIEKYGKKIRSKQAMKDFFDSLQMKPNSKLRYLAELKQIAPLYCEGISFRKFNGDPDPFTQDEVKLILNWMADNKPDYFLFFSVWFDTGLRNGEIRALRKQDIDSGLTRIRVTKSMKRDGTLKGTKNGKARTVPSSAIYGLSFSEVFPELLPESFVFPQLDSESNLVNRIWKPCLSALGIRYRKLYCIRHTAISRKVKEYKGDIAKVARESGNTSKMISDHYLGVFE